MRAHATRRQRLAALAHVLLLPLPLACATGDSRTPPRTAHAGAPSPLATSSRSPVERADGGRSTVSVEVRVDRALSALHARVCGPRRAERLAPLDARGTPYLRNTRADGDACFRYEVDLRAATTDRSLGLTSPVRLADALLLPPELWLWLPEPRPSGPLQLSVAVDSAPVALPWPRAGRTSYEAAPNLDELMGQAAFGTFVTRTVESCNEQLTVSAFGRAQPEPYFPWVKAARRAVAPLLPTLTQRTRPLWLLVEDRASPFGYVARGGGAVVVVRVPRDTSALQRDWVLVHELTHLAFPPLRGEDAWLAEGLATFFGPVLQHAAGESDERELWEDLLSGFERGARGARAESLNTVSASMREHHAYHHVYWAGAWFLLELATHAALQGDSLAAAAPRATRTLGTVHQRTATELLRAFAEELADPTLPARAATFLGQRGFPDFAPTLARLGVARSPDGALLLAADHRAELRRKAVAVPTACQ